MLIDKIKTSLPIIQRNRQQCFFLLPELQEVVQQEENHLEQHDNGAAVVVEMF